MGDPGEEAGSDTEPSTVVERLRAGVQWLRDLHRGFAYTGHLPRRRN